MIDYSYSEEEGIVRVIRKDSIDKAQILDYITSVDKEFGSKKQLKILTDSNHCTIDLVEDDYPEIIDALKNILCKYYLVKKAILINKPDDVALSFLFEQVSRKLFNFRYKTFSDEELALEWLNQS